MAEPVIDPTKNVADQLNAAVKRLDDLRESDSRHIRELLEKEAQRIDANRQVDQLAVTNLAARREQDAEAQRQLVSSTAAALAAAQTVLATGFNERLSKLEERSYKGEGRGGGMQQFWGWIVGVIFLLIALWNQIRPALGH